MNAFDKIKFRRKDHTYWLGEQPLTSVTQTISRIAPKFDADGNAARMAARDGTTKEAILELWQRKSRAALDKGTAVHAFIEQIIKGKRPKCAIPEAQAWLEWWRGAKRYLDPVGVEMIVGDSELGVAGTMDFLAHSSKNGKTTIIDWKTGSKFETENRWGRFLLPPFSDLPDNELHRYSLQVSLYRLILERAGFANMGESYIVHLGPEKAHAYKAHDYRKRLEAWLCNAEVTP